MKTATPAAPGTETWESALDRLEADLTRCEELLSDPEASAELPDWTPPSGLGPIPSRLVVRAQDVLHRQERVRGRLVAALGANTRQRSLAARITDATTTRSVPTYLDVNA